jgi:hypothetical protein
MEETDIFKYFAFGYNYRLLQDSTVGKSVTGEEDSLDGMVKDFFTFLDELDLVVTRQASEKLRGIQQRIKSTSSTVVDGTLSKAVTQALNSIDTTLDAELQLRKAYVVTPKRFELRYLLETPSQLLSPQAPAQMPEIAKYDFSHACRCVAFSLPTAAVFHLMRCAEGMLRHYYCTVVKRKRVSPLLWGRIIEHLRRQRKPPPKALLDHLDNLRENFRNPTQHPEARYNLQEAQDLLAVTIEVINRIARDLSARA